VKYALIHSLTDFVKRIDKTDEGEKKSLLQVVEKLIIYDK
jgi:hypothetical protein